MAGTYTNFLGTLELFYLSTAPYSTMSQPYMDGLIKKASTELDKAKREKTLQEAYTYIYDQYWNPSIVWANYIMGAGPRIKDWKPRQGACFPSRFHTIKLNPGS
jgi:ABC-type transport system substrate-binding protein